MPYKLLIAFIILLPTAPAYAFTVMPVKSFDALSYFSFFSLSEDGDRTIDDANNDANNDINKNVDRSGYHGYFSFAPTDNWAFYISRYEVTLKDTDGLYKQPAGPKDELKTGYERTGIGVRTLFFNERGSPVKVGLYSEFILNNTADQDGEAFSTMPFFYIGHNLPISLRFGYNVEASRRKTRIGDSSVTKADEFYSSHVYLRVEPYNSVARFPVGYEYYQRNGTAPDALNFDVKKERIIEHSVFVNLPANILLTLKLQDSEDIEQVSLGVEIPFF